MSTRPSSASGQQVWWAAVAVVGAVVMVLKPSGQVTVGEWKWVLGGLGVVMLWRFWGLLRSSSSSPGRILLWLALMAMGGSVGVIGIPTHWLRVPAWSEVGAVAMPLLLGVVALAAVLFGLAGLNRRRELNGSPQRSYLPIVLNLIIVAAAWHVVRQPLWKESLQGMMRLPQLHSNRVALEETIAPWVNIIEHGDTADSATGTGSTEARTGTTNSTGTTQAADQSTHPLTPPETPNAPMASTMSSAPSNAEQWIQAAVHNINDPLLELRASIALVAEGRSDQALSRLAAARGRGCQSPDLIRFHARLLRAKGRPAAAATVLEALVLSPDGSNQDLQECLGAWEQAGQPDRAENLAERLLVRRPTRDLFRWLAARDAAEGRHERALVLLGQLSRRTPFDPADAYQLAEVALRAGRPELALDAVALLENAGHTSPRTSRLANRARASGVADLSTPLKRPGS